MPTLTFLPSGRAVAVEPGEELLTAATRAGLRIETECGGKGVCRACLLLVEEGAITGESALFLPAESLDAGYALACVSRVGNTDATLRLSQSQEQLASAAGHFAESAADSQTAPLVAGPLSPLVQRARLTINPARPLDGLCDCDRVTQSLKASLGAAGERVQYPLATLRQMGGAVRGAEGLATALYAFEEDDDARLTVIDLAPGHTTGALYGAAVDLGTTSVAVSLVDLESGRVAATHSAYNEQIAHGLDVISRINFSQRPGGLQTLRTAARKSINALLRQAAATAGARSEEIAALSLAGNTVMTHLLLGLDPEQLRLAPYTPTVFCPRGLRCKDLGLAGRPEAPLLFGPAVGSYVGGDISTGLLCTDINEREGAMLYIDIGTNGEIALGNRDFLMACACSAGPAFEGGELSCGMRAADGAIEAVSVNPADGTPTCSLLGAEQGARRPLGVCGTGVIGCVAELFATGWLDAAGKLRRDAHSPAIAVEGRRASYTLTPTTDKTTGRAIVLTEADIENLMRAKAAIYAGCSYLLEQAGLEFDELAGVAVAGGFGRFLNVEQSIRIGLLPDLPRERFTFLGNASRKGAALALLSREKRRLRSELAQRMTYLDLSNAAGYMDHYTAALFLPHTDQRRFPSAPMKNA